MGAVEDLAAELARLNKRIARGPQLGDSSIPHGRNKSLDLEDADGNFAAAYGTQFDGTHVVAALTGPPPPQPTAPKLTPGPMSLTVRWNGLFAGGALSPMDFSHVEVHVSSTQGFTPSPSTLRATLRGELGDETVVSPLTASQWYVRLVARSQSSKPSVPSTESVGTPEEIADSMAAGKITVDTAAPTFADGEGKPVNATWSQIDPTTGAQVAFFRWTGTEWVDMPLSETIIPKINIGEGVYGTLKGVSLGADTFKGSVITGALFQTQEQSFRGIKLDSATNTLQMFDPSGQQTLLADGNTGDFVAVGSLLTNLAGARVEVTGRENTAEDRGIAAVDMYADDTANHGALYTEQGVIGSGEHTTVLGHFVTENFQTARLKLREDGYFELSGPAQDSAIWGAAGYMSFRSTDMNFITRSEFHDNVVVTAGTNGPEVLAAFNDTNYPNGTLRSRPTYDNTTGSSANMVVSSGGMLRRSTSLTKHKIAIEQAWSEKDAWRQVKNLNPITFYDKGNAERYAALVSGEDAGDADYPMELLGLLAEDVAEAMPVLNTYGDHGDLNGVAYDRIAVALIPWLKELEGRIAALES